MFRLVVLFLLVVLVGCGTTDSQLLQEGRSAGYVQGFHDGRHSGMREAGNNFEHWVRDEDRFQTDSDYQQGWLAGEAEGKRLQAQAVAIGQGVGNAYSAAKIANTVKQSTDFDAVAKDAVRGIDTKTLNTLEN